MGLVKFDVTQGGVLRAVILCCNLLDKLNICIKYQRSISLSNAVPLNLYSIEESIVALERILKHGFLYFDRKMRLGGDQYFITLDVVQPVCDELDGGPSV